MSADTKTAPVRFIAVSAVVSLLSCAVFAFHAGRMIEAKSVTFDETIYTVLAQSSRSLGFPDPRLASMGVAPLPVWVAHLPANWNQPHYRWQYVDGLPGDIAAVRRSRLISLVVFGMSAIVVVVVWLTRRRGCWAGLAGGLLLACSPSWIAHGALATTDAAVTVCLLLLGAAATAAWRRPSTGRMLIVCVLLGTAVAAKYSAVIGVPIALATVGSLTWRREGHWTANLARFALGVLVLATLGFVVTWTWHGLEWVELKLPQSSWDGAFVPAPIAGVMSQWVHQQRGHEAYLLGEVQRDGWPYYFPVAMFCKSSPTELVALVAILVAPIVGLFAGAVRRDPEGRGDAQTEKFDPAIAVWIGMSLLLWLAAVGSTINIGHRYLLLLYPLAILFLIDWLSGLRGRLGRWLIGVLLAGQVVVAFTAAPHFVAYFSPLVGGSERGHLWLGDSNLDWGQDLPALRQWCERHPRAKGRVVYFGAADLRGAGVDWPAATNADWNGQESFQYLAVSVTVLQQIYDGRFHGIQGRIPAPLATALLRSEPIDRAGYSIWVFDLEQPEMRELLRRWQEDKP